MLVLAHVIHNQAKFSEGFMKPLGLNEIREKYLSFFESKGHLRQSSSSLIPNNDNSLLLINSGMAPLKPFFTGQEIPPSKRLTTCQKCIRTGDIENVGKTARHGTFFEMLGNFSFGDYFKEEVIPWAWEFVTEVLNLPIEKLYVSVYENDDEAFDIWNKKMGLSEDRIFRMGKDDNFWEVGLGPCGPCSEIYFDRGEKYGCGSETCTVGCDCDRYMEFWNLVFTQFSKEEDGSYSNLANPNIDTGMGLERMASIMQDVYSIFDVDTIKAIRDEVCSLIGNVEYGKDPKKDSSIRLITDHVRSIVFMTGDGILPSNEGRGYVLRRLLRRAARHGKMLGIDEFFLSKLSKKVIQVNKDAYSELTEKMDYILKIVTFEEERFYETLDSGMEILKEYVSELKKSNKNVMDGSMSFKLYDTYGFPVDLTIEILEEEGISLDEKAFEEEMNRQKERARAAREESNYMGSEITVFETLDKNLDTKFAGYDILAVEEANILAIIKGDQIITEANKGDEISILTDITPFYAESGGQIGDNGIIKTSYCSVKISNCIKTKTGKIVHKGIVSKGSLNKSDRVSIFVDADKRMDTQRNHSCTHLLHKALRELLGTHVEQAGSLVTPDRMRFDFTHFAPLTTEEIREVENKVNSMVLASLPVSCTNTTIDQAKSMGAMALFGEKYGDVVRVVSMGDYSVELCGGCHVTNTSQISTFKLLSENGIAAGVRRIEALTGKAALEYYQKQDETLTHVSSLVKATQDNLVTKLSSVLDRQKQLLKESEALKAKMSGNIVEDIIQTGEVVNGVTIICYNAGGMDANALRSMGDKIKDKFKLCAVCLAGNIEDKVSFVAMASKEAVQMGVHSGEIVKTASGIAGGKGGGRPDMATAGAKEPEKIGEALEAAKKKIIEQING